VFLILDVEVVKDLAFLSLSKVGVVVLAVELTLPDVDLAVLLLDKADEVLVLIHKVGVLGQQQLDLLLQVVHLLVPTHLEQQLLVHRH
jgi:hypothetical protein